MPSLMRNINIISRCHAAYRVKNSSDNLAGIYHSYVLAICKNPGWSQDRLAKHLCLNKSNVTRHLSFLEENGYIERKTGEDKRELLVFPTQKMLDIFPEVRQIASSWNSLLAESLDEGELEQFSLICDKLSHRARELFYGKVFEDENRN